MNNRYSIGRGTQQAKSTDHSAPSSKLIEKIAAKDADIRAFNEIMRSKKNATRENTSYMQSAITDAPFSENNNSINGYVTHPLLTKHQDSFFHATSSDPLSDAVADGQITKTHIGSVAISQSNEASSAKSTQAVLAVITRIINSTKPDSAPKVWTLEIALDDQNRINLEVQYHGNQEWSLELLHDDSTELTDLLKHESEVFAAALRQELSIARPDITLHDASVV